MRYSILPAPDGDKTIINRTGRRVARPRSIGKFIGAAAGREKCCRTSEGNFFPRLADQDFILYRLDSCQDLEKAAGGTAAVKIPRDSRPGAVQSELYRDNPVTHIEPCTRVRFSSSSKKYPLPPSAEKNRKKRNRLWRAINRPSQPNPASAPSRSVARLEGKRETSLSLMPAAMLSVSRPISGRGCKATTGE